MKKLGFEWPEKFNCDRLPDREEGSNILCLDFNMPKKYLPALQRPVVTEIPVGIYEAPKSQSDDSQCCNKCQFPSFSAVVDSSAKINGVSNCASRCVSPFFRDADFFPEKNIGDEKVIDLWLSGWSIGCLVISAITCLTFILNPVAIEYPERPIVYLSFCYFLISVGYIIRVVVGHVALSCDRSGPVGETVAHAVLPGRGEPLCLFNFLFTYFFWMSASLWWVCLCFTWFLAAALKWSKEAIQAWLKTTAATSEFLLLMFSSKFLTINRNTHIFSNF